MAIVATIVVAMLPRPQQRPHAANQRILALGSTLVCSAAADIATVVTIVAAKPRLPNLAANRLTLALVNDAHCSVDCAIAAMTAVAKIPAIKAAVACSPVTVGAVAAIHAMTVVAAVVGACSPDTVDMATAADATKVVAAVGLELATFVSRFQAVDCSNEHGLAVRNETLAAIHANRRTPVAVVAVVVR